MIYLINSTEDYLIKKEINKIIKLYEINEFNINTFSMLNNSIEEIIEDFQTYSMFGDKKLVIVEDSIVFTSKKNDINLTLLEDYLNNLNESTIIIFLVNEKLDERKKIVKKIKEVGEVKILDEIVNLNEIVKEMFNNYLIDIKTIELLIQRVGKNLKILEQEIIKIKIFKENNLTITKEDIYNLTSKNIESDIFSLIDFMINKEKNKAIEMYHELIKNNEEPISMIITLANKLRMIYQTKELFKRGYTEKDVAQILKVKPGYLYYMRKNLNSYNEETIIKLLDKLSILDYEIKAGKIDRYQGLELFILEM